MLSFMAILTFVFYVIGEWNRSMEFANKKYIQKLNKYLRWASNSSNGRWKERLLLGAVDLDLIPSRVKPMTLK